MVFLMPAYLQQLLRDLVRLALERQAKPEIVILVELPLLVEAAEPLQQVTFDDHAGQRTQQVERRDRRQDRFLICLPRPQAWRLAALTGAIDVLECRVTPSALGTSSQRFELPA